MQWLDSVTRHWGAWRTAWDEQRHQRPTTAPRRREAEFLPAVLEIQDSPPSPVGRAVGGTVVAVFLAGIVWACLGKIDIVAVAPGKIIPSGYSKVVQPLDSGVVLAIHVKDGQAVKKGEVLIELDPTLTGAEGERFANEHRAALVHAARLRALIAGHSTFVPPKGADLKFVALQQHMLQNQSAEFKSRVEAAQHLIDQRKAAIEATKASITRYETTVPMDNERATAFKQLVDQNIASRMEYLAAEKQRVEETQELARQKEIFGQDSAALAEAQQNYQTLISEFQKTRHDELSDQETKAASLFQERVKATQRTGLQKLTAPIDGEVQQLAAHTIGGVVTPAQQLLVVVPFEHQLEAEVMVENKDIGFVKKGQRVELKVETFPFTRYGLIDGEIMNVTTDAVQMDKSGEVAKGNQGPQSGILVYPARVSLSKSIIQVDGKPVRLSPGMAVTAEIKTGTRRLIEFFLSPLLKSGQESLRER
jgi:hemolysin D